MWPALLLLLSCPTPGPRPVVTGTVTVSSQGTVSGRFQLVAPAPAQFDEVGFGAEVHIERCEGLDVVEVHYEDGHPHRGPDGALFLLGTEGAWLPHPRAFHDMQVWLRLPVGWSGRVSGEQPTGPPRCDAQVCLQGPYVGTGQPGAMLVAAPHRLHRAEGNIEVFVAPEHEASLEPLLKTLVAQEAAFSARFGPRATRSLAVFESQTDGGFSVHGLIALSSGAIAAFAEGDREAPLLAHELCHHWFGSVASGEPWITEGLCRHCELWWVQRTRSTEASEAFAAQLADQSDEARPGLTLRDMRGQPKSWRDYEAVAYSRGALVHERFRQALGPERWDQALRAHLKVHRGQRVEVERFLALTASVAPEADIDALARRWLDQDVDPRTGQPRPWQFTLPGRAAAVLAAALLLLSLWQLGTWPRRALALFAFVLVLFLLWRGPGWVWGWPVIGAAVLWLAGLGVLRRRANRRP